MDISVIIPNYNGENLLKENLGRVYQEVAAYKLGEAEIIVVDDGSSDGSVNFLNEFSKTHRNFKVLVGDKNLGFAPTVNKGVSAAKGEVVILLNTDVCPEKGFLEPLLKHFSDPKVFAVGCLDKSIEGDKVTLRGRGLGEWKRGFLVHRRGEVNKANTLWVSGGSAAFRKSVWEKLGGFNELYAPFYYEDIDLSYRALKAGFDVLFEPKSIVVHEHEKGAIKSKYSGFAIKTIAYRNQFIFVWENATDFSLRLTHVVWLPYHLAQALVRFDLAFYLGFFEALILLPKIIITSLIVKRQFILSDKEVISKFK
ncbi:MAG TPA: glycosyltransferase family 2 protein [Patescibacteria group bacterium]|jgi:GT2 family glycosyltransferase|nr:glycosyltransferase family 2 protein [Patescibacteria group bacterium]